MTDECECPKCADPTAEDFERLYADFVRGLKTSTDEALNLTALRNEAARRRDDVGNSDAIPEAAREAAIEAAAKAIIEAFFGGSPKLRDSISNDPKQWRDEAAAAIAAYEAHRGGGADLLAELEKHPSWQLSWDEHPHDSSLGCWQIRSVRGVRNDRQWMFIASGSTPAEAIKAAIETKL